MERNPELAFEEFLKVYGDQLKESEAFLRAQDKTDEAIHMKIRGNVVTILEKMYQVSLRNVETGITNPAMLKAVDPQSSKQCQLKDGYLAIFNNITTPWQESMERARAHGDVVAAVIEETKLDTAQRIRAAFLSAVEREESHG